MIVSNLKLTYTVFGFFILTASKVFAISESQETNKATLADKITLVVICLAIVFLIIYPISTMIFLTKNQSKLTTPIFKRKFNTLYDGMYTRS